MTRRVRPVVLLVLLAGCIFRSAEAPRFFRPGSAMLESAAADGIGPPAGGVAVRVRGVRSEPFLRERIVWRASEVEYGLYEQRRWIDLPAHYVDDALQARLRSTPGLHLTDDPQAAAALRVDVLAFDEVLAPTHAADVALAVAVDSPTHGRLLDRRFDARAVIPDSEPASMAKAMGEALDDAVVQVAEAVRVAVAPPRK